MRAGRGDTDAAVARCAAQRIEADHGRCFGQAIAFGDGCFGDFAPPPGHRLVQGGATGNRCLELFGRVGQKPFFIEQAVVERVDPGHPGDGVVFNGALQVLHRARAGHQHVARANHQKAQQVGRKSEDVIQRQGGQHTLLAHPHVGGAHGQHLVDVVQQIAVGEHGAFADTRGATGVLQCGQIVRPHAFPIAARRRLCQGGAAALQGVGQALVWHRHIGQHPVPHLLYRPNHGAWHGREERGHIGQHHVFEAGLRQHGRQLVGKHVNDHQGLCTRVLELVHHFFFGVQRVGVDQHTAGFEYTKSHHRVSQAVGQLHCYAVAGLEAKHTAQIASKRVRQGVHLGKTQAAVHAVGHHAGEGGLFGRRFGKPRAGAVNQRGQVGVNGCREFGNDACPIVGGAPWRVGGG